MVEYIVIEQENFMQHFTGPNSHLKEIRQIDDSKGKPIRNEIGYKLNSWIGAEWLYRCDEFTKDHDGKHVIFAGCSFTSGEALEPEETWAYKTHQRMSGTSGYYNIGVSGLSITDIVDQIFKYIYNYGNPDEIYILFPNASRDLEYCGNDYKHVQLMVWRSYSWLEQYCKSNNIKLYSFTWEIPVFGWPLKPDDITTFKGGEAKSIYPDQDEKKYYPGTTEERDDWSQQLGDETIKILKDFETFHYFSESEMEEAVFKYDTGKNKGKKYSLIAKDNVHPGESFHDFYADFICKKANIK
jgi:hypothetical protein